MKFESLLAAVVCVLSAAFASNRTFADDWPGWRGHNRDGICREMGLLKEWPKEGPRLVWTAKACGGGYVCPAISQGVIYTAGDIGNDCFVMALDLEGKLKWKTSNGNAWTGAYPGARGTPTISGGMTYHLNAHGDLACLGARTGSKIWARNVLKEFGASNIAWALAESVLVDRKNVICRPGGRDACLVALDARTGKTVWTSKPTGDQASHSSSISSTFADVRHVVSLTSAGVVAVNAENGELLWRHPLPWSNQTIPTPVYADGCVFITTGDFCGNLKLAAEGDKITAQELWRNDNLKTDMSGAVLVNGHLYGFHVCTPGNGVAWTSRPAEQGGL